MKKTLFYLLLFFASEILRAQPGYTVNFQNGLSTITCANPTVNIFVTNNFPSPVSYTWTSPQSGTFSGSAVSISIPGNYTLTVNSGTFNANVPVAILSNTVQPDISISAPQGKILSCNTASISLQASSLTQGATFLYAGPQGSVSATSVTVNANYNTAPSILPFETYTFFVTDPANQCRTASVVTVYQNIYPPNAAIAASYSAITCQNYSVNLTNNSSSTIPPMFNPTQPVVASLWEGPVNLPNSASYVANAPGLYTLTAKDMNNGCTSKTIIDIADNRIYPIFVQPGGTYTIACPGGTTAINVQVIGGNNGYTYSWTVPAGAVVTASNTGSIFVNSPGQYIATAKNLATGCAASANFYVYACVGIEDPDQEMNSVRIFPNPAKDEIQFVSAGGTNLSPLISITNGVGQLVYYKTKHDLSQPIDLRGLSPGIYFIRISGSESVKTFRILKE